MGAFVARDAPACVVLLALASLTLFVRIYQLLPRVEHRPFGNRGASVER